MPASRPQPLTVLYEDNHCLAVAKPAGLLTMGDRTGDLTLVDAAKEYLRTKYAKPGAVYLGVVHRLDRPVSGVVLFARTSKAAARLSEQFREHSVQKTYWAWVESNTVPPRGELTGQIAKDHNRNISRVVASSESGRDCRLSFVRKTVSGGRTWIELQPETGRSHQLRVQLSHAGWPIVGDRKYGAHMPWPPGTIALHAVELTFAHPISGEAVHVSCPAPASWSLPPAADPSKNPSKSGAPRRPPLPDRRMVD